MAADEVRVGPPSGPLVRVATGQAEVVWRWCPAVTGQRLDCFLAASHENRPPQPQPWLMRPPQPQRDHSSLRRPAPLGVRPGLPGRPGRRRQTGDGGPGLRLPPHCGCGGAGQWGGHTADGHPGRPGMWCLRYGQPVTVLPGSGVQVSGSGPPLAASLPVTLSTVLSARRPGGRFIGSSAFTPMLLARSGTRPYRPWGGTRGPGRCHRRS